MKRKYPPFTGYSLSNVVLWMFVPILTGMLLIFGIFALQITKKQIYETTETSMTDKLFQASSYLDTQLAELFQAFTAFENDGDMLAMMLRMNEPTKIDRIGGNHYVNMRNLMDRTFASHGSSLDSILVDINNSRFRIYQHEKILSNVSFDFTDWYRQFPDNQYHWLGPHTDEIFLPSTRQRHEVVSLFRLYGNNESALHGIVIFNLPAAIFEKILSVSSISENGYIALISDDTITPYETIDQRFLLSADTVKKIASMPDITQAATFKNNGNKNAVVYTRHLKTNDWILMTVIPEAELLSGVTRLRNVMIAAVLALIAAGITITRLLSRAISRPIVQLANDVAHIDIEQNFALQGGGLREVHILREGIRTLVYRINRLLLQIKQQQQQKREAELSLLQAQINPHFLYNTLYSIQQLCAMNEAQEASRMILALSSFFRIGLSKGHEEITVEEESEHVRNYLYLQQMKYSDKLEYEIHVQPQANAFRLPKLTLQPLVENSIYHGIKEKRGKGLIEVTCSVHNNRLQLIVRDNGAGMSAARLMSVQESLLDETQKNTVSFGLKSVFARLNILYQEQLDFRIESVERCGTCIFIEIPATSQLQIQKELPPDA